MVRREADPLLVCVTPVECFIWSSSVSQIPGDEIFPLVSLSQPVVSTLSHMAVKSMPRAY